MQVSHNKEEAQSNLHGISAPSKASSPDACVMDPPPPLPSLEYCCPAQGQLAVWAHLCAEASALYNSPVIFFPNWKTLSHGSLIFFKGSIQVQSHGVENSRSFFFLPFSCFPFANSCSARPSPAFVLAPPTVAQVCSSAASQVTEGTDGLAASSAQPHQCCYGFSVAAEWCAAWHGLFGFLSARAYSLLSRSAPGLPWHPWSCFKVVEKSEDFRWQQRSFWNTTVKVASPCSTRAATVTVFQL